eukprot:Skav236110  [mRNA]  locus=scaffold1166:419262:423886:+ [translate_table: standard]
MPWLSWLLLLHVNLPLRECIYLKGSKTTCAPLSNQGLYSTVKVSIGDPAQTFDLVADTGSDACIVKDCGCDNCPSDWGSCFGQEQSQSLKLLKVADGIDQSTESPAAIVMSFGSGDISTHVASDKIQLGAVACHFEGILGLGRPQNKTEEIHEVGEDTSKLSIQVPNFLESAGVRRFSLCFNHGDDGILGLKTREHKNLLSSTGQVHWALRFHGVSVGEQEMKVDFCQNSTCSVIPDSGTTLFSGPEDQISSIYEALCKGWQRCRQTHKELHKEMKRLTDEGVRIEGTFERKLGLIESDPQKILKIFEQIVDQTTASADEGHGMLHDPKFVVLCCGFELPPTLTLQLLLEHCERWIGEVDINNEMPELFFYVSGANGNRKKVKLSPNNYVLAKYMDVEVPGVRTVLGFNMSTKQIKHKQVCTMAFTPTDYSTVADGQIWIMGTPLFYEHTVHYDRGSSEGEVGMAFTSQNDVECGHCKGDEIVRSQSLIASKDRAQVGIKSLNFLAHEPIVRNLTGVKFL